MKPLKLMTLSAIISLNGLTACSLFDNGQDTQQESQTLSEAKVVENYIEIAHSKYSDSLETAVALNEAITQLLAAPNSSTLEAARSAWLAARVPYQQTEVYRFGNASVDNWEGKVNAWPLDEGLIDYVDTSYGEDSDENPFYTANIIANPKLTVGGKLIDASIINKTLLSDTLHEIDEVESNVATGYHVIEFLLWGQDLNGTQPGAGNRPASDFSLTQCTGGNCERRRDYLRAATQLLIDDLNDMVKAWSPNGEAVNELLAKGDAGGVATMLSGMGSLAYGELAGERTKLGLMVHDPEEEHDCFSDNTHFSHYYDAKGIKNIYLGEYISATGTRTAGASLSDLVKRVDTALDQEMRSKLDITEAKMQAMVDEAQKGNTFDVLIGANNTAGNQIVKEVVDALVDQAKTTEKIIVALGLENIEFEGSDSLDNPASIGG